MGENLFSENLKELAVMVQRIALVLLLLAPVGCATSRSTMLHRNESDTAWEKERFLNGVPITVQVPTHIRVDIIEHRYLGLTDLKSSENGLDMASGTIRWLDEKAIDVPIRSVNTTLIKTAKIFTVDPKRPAAGTIDATMKFGGVNGQYIEEIDYMVEDKTIEAITGVLKQVAQQGLIGLPTAEDGAGRGVDELIQRVDGIVASGFFSLDAPDLEIQLARFLQEHLNGCHTCRVVPPGVEVPQRLPAVGLEACEVGHIDGPNCPHCSGVVSLVRVGQT